MAIAASVDGTADFVNLYEYDAEGRLVELKQTGQGGNAVADKHVAFGYNQAGQLATVTRYASLGTSELVAVSEYGYDELGRLASLVHYQDPAEPLAEYAWTYQAGSASVVHASDGGGSGTSFGFGGAFAMASYLKPSVAVQAEVNPLPDEVWLFDAALTGNGWGSWGSSGGWGWGTGGYSSGELFTTLELDILNTPLRSAVGEIPTPEQTTPLRGNSTELELLPALGKGNRDLSVVSVGAVAPPIPWGGFAGTGAGAAAGGVVGGLATGALGAAAGVARYPLSTLDRNR